jgi:hypothetical protein
LGVFLVAACEARGIDPFEYIADVLARCRITQQAASTMLLPVAWAAARDE